MAHKPIYRFLKQAIYCFTEIKNRELCELAIVLVATDADQEAAKYTRVYWLQTAPKWGMYAQQHSPLHLQVTTTNCETWHRKLKSGAGLLKGQVVSHGIFGMILNIIDAANDVDNRAAIAKSHFRNRNLAVCTKQYPEIGKLAVPIQILLAGALELLRNILQRVRKYLPLYFNENSWCHCKFYSNASMPAYYLPP